MVVRQFLLVCLLCVSPTLVTAATLSLSPPTTQVSLGSPVMVSVMASANAESINGVSGTIIFPADKLQVASVSKSGSIINLWLQEPMYDNTLGKITFEGIVLNPGFTGNRGSVINIVFQTKGVGPANLIFSDGSILANDGSGSNVLRGLSGGQISISGGYPVLPVANTGPVSDAPDSDVYFILSDTHPDQESWYSRPDANFTWILPNGALEVKLLVDQKPKSLPTTSYSPPISSKLVEGLVDGVHYFHLQVRTGSGWQPVSHYRLNVDTKPPEPFRVSLPHGEPGNDPQPVLLFNTSDDGSGVDHYEVNVGNGSGLSAVAPMAKSNPYVLPVQPPGRHTVVVAAVDVAGNRTSASADFEIKPIAPPTITFYNKSVSYHGVIKFIGTTYPAATVTITISRGDSIVAQEEAPSNSLGSFDLVLPERLGGGSYTVSATVTDRRGASSGNSVPIKFRVKYNYHSIGLSLLLGIGILVLWGRMYYEVHALRQQVRGTMKK